MTQGIKKEKCLVTKAMKKCQCEWCKQQREFTQIALNQIVSWEIYKIMTSTLEKDMKAFTKGEDKVSLP